MCLLSTYFTRLFNGVVPKISKFLQQDLLCFPPLHNFGSLTGVTALSTICHSLGWHMINTTAPIPVEQQQKLTDPSPLLLCELDNSATAIIATDGSAFKSKGTDPTLNDISMKNPVGS